MSIETAALAIGILLAWIAVVHFALAVGIRRGELVWSGKQPRLLAPDLRLRSAVFAVLLLVSGWVLAEANGLVSLIPELYLEAAEIAVAVFLGLDSIYALIWGTRWERGLFAPILLVGAILAGWLAFS